MCAASEKNGSVAAPPAVSPVEALRIVTRRIRPKAPRSFAVDEAPAGWLASEVAVPLPVPAGGTGDRVPRALTNGYALVGPVSRGDIVAVGGTRTAAGELLDPHGFKACSAPEADGPAAVPAGGRALWRVETGAALPEGTWAVLAVRDAPVVATCRVRIDVLPEPGTGIDAGNPAARRDGLDECCEGVLRFPAGTFLDARVRAVLEAGEAPAVEVRPRFAAAFATIGAELTDPAAARSAAAASAFADLLALALEKRLQALQLTTVALGILDDTPQALQAAALRARKRKVDVLLLAGGLGDGVTDRTCEGLRRMEAEIVFHAAVFGPGSALVLARLPGHDVLALSGSPLVAAAQLDLFVVPALRARLGAPRRSWDWSLFLRPVRLRGTAAESLPITDGWQVHPAALAGGGGEPLAVEVWPPPTRSVPRLPGQDGWAIIAPGRAEEASRASGTKQQAYFQPCPET